MLLPIDGHSESSSFFKARNKQAYKVLLTTASSYMLSEKDTEKLITMLSKYKWKHSSSAKVPDMEKFQNSWGWYHYYLRKYLINITHPDGRVLRLTVNGSGIEDKEHTIEYPDGLKDTFLELEGSIQQDDIEFIKNLFLENTGNFENIQAVDKGAFKIVPVFTFYPVFELKLPEITVDAEDSKELLRLYNSAWNNSTGFGGHPAANFYLYSHYKEISYNRNMLPYGLPPVPHNSYELQFKTDDFERLGSILNKWLKGNSGDSSEERINYMHPSHEKQVIHYQYKDGYLHGNIQVCDDKGNLTHELVYNEGLPVHHVQYNKAGKKAKEFHFDPLTEIVEWTEYDEQGHLSAKGTSPYGTHFYDWKKLQNFYRNETEEGM